MRIDEIMMGDWVYDGENTQIPMKIEGIFDDGRVYLNFEDNNFEDNYAYAWVEDLRPIPMTEEIAIKNGWECTIEAGSGLKRYNRKCREISDGRDILIFFFADGRFTATGEIAYCYECQYVHELQQGFRRKGLFDLAKEIKV